MRNREADRSLLALACTDSQETTVYNSAFSHVTLVARDQPWREYLYHRNQQILKSGLLNFCILFFSESHFTSRPLGVGVGDGFKELNRPRSTKASEWLEGTESRRDLKQQGFNRVSLATMCGQGKAGRPVRRQMWSFRLACQI